MFIRGILVVAVPTLLAALLLLAVQRLVPPERREPSNDVASYIYALIGVIYAIVLAFAVIAVWEADQAASDNVQREADALTELYWVGRGIPDPAGERIRGHVGEYTTTVIDEEWPLMAEGRVSDEAAATLRQLRVELQGLEATAPTEQLLAQQGLDYVSQVAAARQERTLAVGESIGGVLWFGLLAGAVVMVAFTYLFGLQSTVAHLIMVVTLTAMLAFTLYTIQVMDRPFSGPVRLQPDALDPVLRLTQQS